MLYQDAHPNFNAICHIKTPIIDSIPKDVQHLTFYKGKDWTKGQTILVNFLNGTPDEHEIVKEVYKELSFVNLNFEFVPDYQISDVRWTFTKGAGSWSYLGTDAMLIGKQKPTINIGWTIDKATVRHEIGHQLGAPHEHQNPNANIAWNRDNVIRDLSGPPNSWTLQQITYNVFDAVQRERLYISAKGLDAYDKKSIMHYFFPDSWVLSGGGFTMNTTWSNQDITAFSEKYPHPVNLDRESFALIKDLFPNKKRLWSMNEPQLVRIASELNISTSVDALKKDTISQIYNVLHG